MFFLMSTWLVLLQVWFRIPTMLIMSIIYEGDIFTFWCLDYFWVNDIQIFLLPRNILCLIIHNINTSFYTP